MKVSKESLVKLFVALGKKAETWNVKRLESNLERLEEIAQGQTVEDADLATLLQEVIDAQKGEGVEVESTEPSSEAPEPKKKGRGRPKKTETSEGSTKPKKEKKEGKGDAFKKVGIVDTIVETLIKASSKHPVTKKEILEKLVAKYPERDSTKMKATVGAQVPTFLRIRKGIEVQKNDQGYWIDKGNIPTEKSPKAEKKEKASKK